MIRRIVLLVVTSLGIGGFAVANAASAVCTMQTGLTGAVSETCGQSLFVATQFLDWGSSISSGGLGEATFDPYSGTLSALSSPINTLNPVSNAGGVGVTLSSSNDLLQRADNTAYAWDNSLGWTPPIFIAQQTINTFDGHFNAPSQEVETPVGTNRFGDNLLGVLAPAGNSVGSATLSITFSQLISGAEFQVSSRQGTNADFIAILQAFDSSGNLIGSYTVNTNGAGLGGECPGLSNPNTGLDPVPCNNAPLIQFYDPNAQIKSVLLTVNDITGAYIDTLSINPNPAPPPGAPEPAIAVMIGAGLALMAFGAWRPSITSRLRPGFLAELMNVRP